MRTPRHSGRVVRFNGTVLDAFFRVVMRRKVQVSPDPLRADLDAWLSDCNTERPRLGGGSQGRGPPGILKELVSQQG